jgi:hypothetical protein
MSLLDDYQQIEDSFDYEKQIKELNETYEEWKDIEYKCNKKNKDINEIINRFIIGYIFLLIYCMKFLVLYINNHISKHNFNHLHIKYKNYIEELD